MTKDYLRYHLIPSGTPLEDIIFVPYWRFRGIYYCLRPFEVKNKVLDTSFLGSGHKFLPASLGLRTQTLKLRFAAPEMKADFLSPCVSFGEAISRVEKISHSIEAISSAGRVFHRAFIGDTVSMIYSPVYIRSNAIYDGVLNRPVASFTKLRAEQFQSIDTRKDWGIRFISALCPNCGWDLTGERNSVVLFCGHCDMAWQVSKGSFKRLDFAVFSSREKNVVYIPFWRMKVKIEGFETRSYADLIRIANLPKAIKKEWEKRELYFWSPAFKTSPRLFLRLARQMTILQPPEEFKETLPGSDLYPVTLNVSETLESVKVILANLAVPKRKIFPLLSGMDVKLKGSRIVYFPFTVRGAEFIQTEMKFTIQRNALRR